MKKNKGITLIALVVTIVVLLILAGVTINLLFSDTGIIKTAQKAKDAQKIAEYKDRIELAKVSVAIQNGGNVPIDKFIEELKKEGIVTDSQITKNADGSYTISPEKGIDIKITPTSDGKNVTVTYPETITGNGGSISGGGETTTVQAQSVSLSQTTANLKVGESLTLTATVLPENTTNKSVTWQSSNPAVATVANGVVTAVGAGEANITVTTADGSNKTVICNITVEKINWVTSEDEVTVPVPIGFVPSIIAGEKMVDEGFVIKQGNNGAATSGINEFVWVPVANPADMFTVDNKGNPAGQLYKFTETTSTKIEYTSNNWREPDIVVGGVGDSNDADSTYLSTLGLNSSTEFKTQLQNEFKEMKKSVEKYKGFYIGRYETGNLSQNKAVVQKNNNDINKQNWYTMYQKSKGIVEGTMAKSTMIWGCQWDACLRWMQTSSKEDVKKFVTDSTGKGNYEWLHNTGLIPTGSNENYKVNNIYDMAGNVYDYTLEAYTSLKRVHRRRLLRFFGSRRTSILSR